MSPDSRSARSAALVARARQDQQRRRRRWLIGLVAAAAVLALAITVGVRLLGQRDLTVEPVTAGAPVSATDGQPLIFGEPDAAVTIDLFSDFRCPHCRTFAERFDPVLDTAIADGSARLAYWPLSGLDPQYSPPTANAFVCAAGQGIGRPYATAIHGNFSQQWTDDRLVELGRSLDPGVPAAFETCVRGNQHGDYLASLDAAADARGVSGTPTVFLAGQPVDLSTVQPDDLAQMIQEKQ